MSETWKDIDDYAGFYQVSDRGRVRSRDRKVKVAGSGYRALIGAVKYLGINNQGYNTVSLCKDGKQSTKKVHRLVAQAFINTTENYWEVNHLDGNKLNNNKNNLEWSTRSDNMRHAINTGLIDIARGADCNSSKLSDKEVLSIRKLYNKGERPYQYEIAEMFNVDRSVICEIINRKIWTHI